MKKKYWIIIMLVAIFNWQLSTIGLAMPQFLDKLSDSEQLVRVHSLKGSKGFLTYWEADEHGQWRQASDDISVVVGSNGAVSAEAKQEGDGCTPKGLYALSMAFGYEPLIGVKMPYKVLTENDFWVDEPKSPAYNTLVGARPKDGSYEVMRRADRLYSFGLVVDYNRQPIVAYKGSAIFLHIWRSPVSPTAGCIAMDKEQLRKLILWLEPTKNPLIMIE